MRSKKMFFKKNLVINPLILTFLIFLAWYKILFLTPIGEGGYMYFSYMNTFLKGLLDRVLLHNNFTDFLRYDFGTYLFFGVVGPLFKDNFFFYQLIIFSTLIILAVLFYFIVFELTSRKSTAFISAVIFGVNYNSIFEMFAFGSYANFFQRVFFLLLLFPSLLLFFKFIKNKKNKYYLFSLLLAILSVDLAHFSFFYIPFLFMYLLSFLLLKKMDFKQTLFLVSSIMGYVLMTYLIIHMPTILNISSWLPTENIGIFIFRNTNEIIVQFFRQLTILSVPDVIFRQIFSIIDISYAQVISQSKGIQYFYIPIFLVYIAATIFLLKKERKLRPVIIASLFFLPCIFTLNLYMRGTITISSLEPGSRYSFVPSIGYSIFWGIFLSHFLFKSKNVVYPVPFSKLRSVICVPREFNIPWERCWVYLIMSIWIVLQIMAIDRQLQEQSPNHIATKKIIFYFKNELSSRLKEDSIVFTPYLMGNWGSDYLNMFYGKGHTAFIPRMTPDIEWMAEANRRHLKRSFDPKRDFIISYDYGKEKVIDLTKDYKTIIK